MTEPAAPAALRIGPLLRWVDETRATVWVETDRPTTVRVLDAEERTWSVHGHHYALVEVGGLEPGSATPYDVRLDGVRVWPPEDFAFPTPTIRTTDPAAAVRLSFGSCRALAGYDEHGFGTHGADALVALAERTARGEEAPTTLLVMIGDQVYADEPSEEMDERLRARTDVDPEVAAEINSFDEYTWLYEATWKHPSLQWFLATTPTAMILDDHDLRDDWNTSQSWRAEMTAKPWWDERVVGAFGSYWVYQHLGNLAPEQLATDPTYAAVRTLEDDDERTALVDRMAARADSEPSSARWSFSRQVNGVRLVIADSRCRRVLDPASRSMLDEEEFAWLAERLSGDVDHLVLGTSLPWLMTPTVHELESWNEATASGAWGRVFARVAEKIRQAVDLEHWAAYRRSFDRLSELLISVARGTDGSRPHSVLVLSGDVHLSYAARAHFPAEDEAAPVWQLVTSPFRNPLSSTIRRVDRLLNLAPARAAMTWLARRAGVGDPPVRWSVDSGPFFDNAVSTVVIDGPRARLSIELAYLGPDNAQLLRHALEQPLT